MGTSDPATSHPYFSIVIAAHNAWTPLQECLLSIAQQANVPSFEVIVVDDGSEGVPPESLKNLVRSCPITIIREVHAGVSAARNRGVQASRGSVIVFTDADCILTEDCLAALYQTAQDFPQHQCFQLRLTSEGSRLIGRAEILRLQTLQESTLQSDGRIRYLNTAGFALRRSSIPQDGQLFDPVARRGEDTLLLAELIQRNELPFFVKSATVTHVIVRSTSQTLLKDMRSSYIEAETYDIISSKAIRIRMENQQRLGVLRLMWESSRDSEIGRSAFVIAVTRQLLRRSVSVLCHFLPTRARRNRT